MQTSHSPNRARIFGVSYIVEPLCFTLWEAEAIHIGRCAPTTKNVTLQKRDALLKQCMSEHSTSEEGKALYHVRNNLTMKKGLMYMNITPKGETEGLLAFMVPSAHRRTALNGVH